ncbi:MAG TPA: glycosyltransferase family A protein [Capsulimonadaceae bacterium]|nr:glycosyltransferase family A protein [Capsulimonadaceae bacterium]
MAISIIIPAYNAAGFLKETLDSVLAQTATDWELIVVDDGSTDGTAQIARDCAQRDARFRLIRQENGGTARARNAGVKAIGYESEYVLFLDHDDVLETNALEALTSTLEGTSGMMAAHGLARKIDAHGNPIGEGEAAIQNYHRRKLVNGQVMKAGRFEPTTAAMIVFDNLICTPGVALIRRETIEQLTRNEQVFDPGCVPLDDWDFWLRLTRLGDIAFLDRVVLGWRRHEAAGSHNEAAMSAASLRIRERLVNEPLPPELAGIAAYRYKRLLATNRRRAAREALGEGDLTRGLREYLGYMRLRYSSGRIAL